MGNIVTKVPLKDGTIRYFADAEVRQRVAELAQEAITQVETLPAPAASIVNQTFQYIGPTTENYVHNAFYTVVEGEEPSTYVYEQTVYTTQEINEIISGENLNNFRILYDDTEQPDTSAPATIELIDSIYRYTYVTIEEWTYGEDTTNITIYDGYNKPNAPTTIDGYNISLDGKTLTRIAATGGDVVIVKITGTRFGANGVIIDLEDRVVDLENEMENTAKQYDVMPTLSTSLVGEIIQYTGITDNHFTHGYFYECVDSSHVNKPYLAPDGNYYAYRIESIHEESGTYFTIYSESIPFYVVNSNYTKYNGNYYPLIKIRQIGQGFNYKYGIARVSYKKNEPSTAYVWYGSDCYTPNTLDLSYCAPAPSNYRIFYKDTTEVYEGTFEKICIDLNEYDNAKNVWKQNADGTNFTNITDAYIYETTVRGGTNWNQLDVQPAPTPYTLPVASSDTLGGIKVGNNLSIDENGVLSGAAPYELPVSTAATLGGVKIGDNVNVDANGIISVAAPTSIKTVNSVSIGTVTTETEIASFPFYPTSVGNGDALIINGLVSGLVAVTGLAAEITIKVKLDGTDYFTFKQTCDAGYVTIPVSCSIPMTSPAANHVATVTVTVTDGSITL